MRSDGSLEVFDEKQLIGGTMRRSTDETEQDPGVPRRSPDKDMSIRDRMSLERINQYMGGRSANLTDFFAFIDETLKTYQSWHYSDFVDPLVARAIGQTPAGPQLLTQPSYALIYEELASFRTGPGIDRPDNLIDRLLAGPSDTRAIAKGVCAAVLGSAVTLVQ